MVAAASRVLGEAIDSRTHSRLIEESLAQVDAGTAARGQLMASSIGRRYAQAYFDLARQAKKINERREDLARAVATLAHPEVGTRWPTRG